MTAPIAHRRLAAAVLLAGLVLLAACGGGDDSGSSPSATSSAGGSATPAASTPSETSQGGTFDLATQTPLTIIYGAGAGDLPSDQPALAAGDLDGDGLPDLVVGARFADPEAGADAGITYVVYGSSQLPSSVDFGAGQQGLAITGAHPGANFGFSTHVADYNGDGADDLAVGAAFDTTASGQTGAVYIFFGPLPDDGSQLSSSDAGVAISGETATGFFGDSLAAGDVNADGTADLVIGSTFGQERSSSAPSGGAVYVYNGRNDWPATLAASDAEARIYGEDDLDELGDFVTSADLNGDGTDDVIATAEAADGPDNARLTAAQVYVLYGGDGFGGTYDLGVGAADVVIYGAKENDTLGFSLGAGDFDGDGTADLAMGARLADSGGVSRAGIVYVLTGGGDLPGVIDMASPPDSVRSVRGAASGDILGAIVYIGDVDGDGRNELLAGAREASPSGRALSGGLWVVKEMPQTAESIAGAAATTIVGANEGEALGGNVLIADFNGDGAPDTAVVAENAPGPNGQTRTGRVYVIDVR